MEGTGDFDTLYHYGSVEDIWLGNWGIFRSYEKRVPHLIPLPDRVPPPLRHDPLPRRTGKAPKKARLPKDAIPANAIIRKYEVVALNARIDYNEEGDHDPYGIIFALQEDVPGILKKKINPEPLILRANVGEYVEVTLTNQLKDTFHHDALHGYPDVPVSAPFPPSKRISLHTQLAAYDVRHSDGATVGFNPDQTIAPGESIQYIWYIDTDFGSANLTDMADIRNHRHHGAFGILIAETRGSKFLHPKTRKEGNIGHQAIISHPLLPEFREFSIVMHDGVRLLDKNGELIIDPKPLLITSEEKLADFDDQGSRGFNYRNERFSHYVRDLDDVFKVFSAATVRKPSTPLFLAYPGDPVTIRFAFPADRQRAHTITFHGHHFLRSKKDITSSYASFKGESTVGTNDDFHLFYGAGGMDQQPGDYLYRSGNIRWDLELGLWGILRVLKNKNASLAPLNNHIETKKDCDGDST